MSDILAGFVLAAGAGTRLHPLSYVRAKALCPVGNVPLVDHAIERVSAATTPGADHLAVNVHHHAVQMHDHLDGRVHVSWERERALGTAGALGFGRGWIDGRDVLVVNADAWNDADLVSFASGWDRERIRILTVGGTGTLEPTSPIVASLMPWSAVRDLAPEPSGLYEVCWRTAAEDGRVEVITHDGEFVDCGTPAQYLEANLRSSGGGSVVDPAAEVHGTLERCVVWDTGRVAAGEHLRDAIRIGSRLTTLVRPS
jgi:NDP-sugar pyrophosphorylase family protein